MAPKEKDRSNIPINFLDADSEDGADAGRFLAFLKQRLEAFEEGWM